MRKPKTETQKPNARVVGGEKPFVIGGEQNV